MMRIAIAGTNGFARLLAWVLARQTSHQFIILSRNSNAALAEREGWQILRVDYNNGSDLRYKLSGVDTVISTISGNAQIRLIEAAASVHVRRFVPSEFEGPPLLRPPNDLLDRNRRAALQRLQHFSQHGMTFTWFTCGIFYERFAPGGLAASGIGHSSGVSPEGHYIMNVRAMKASLPFMSTADEPVYLSMISARDAARFVVAALDVPSWPTEWRMRGDRLTVSQVVEIGEQLQGREFERLNYTRDSLQHALSHARTLNDSNRVKRVQQLIATAEGRYDFALTNLNDLVPVFPQSFRDWMFQAWS
ncbi:putative isoflavone reductase family protein [Phaeomoniella chlamydospora]|uniref:Putative isoflavone reductase family protein n=1 Tax=Phaeomoniella chlamydospora TaxID=158046 RepID=A0A0G2EYJ9_PHACM|nr:putative isoflavone reductase family protein [Phaeomoniella chlamydospora]